MATTPLASMLRTAEELHPLPASPEVFGIGALVVFAALFAVTWAFRNVARKR